MNFGQDMLLPELFLSFHEFLRTGLWATKCTHILEETVEGPEKHVNVRLVFQRPAEEISWAVRLSQVFDAGNTA